MNDGKIVIEGQAGVGKDKLTLTDKNYVFKDKTRQLENWGCEAHY